MKHETLGLVRRQLEEWGYRVSGEQLELIDEYSRLLAGYRKANVVGTRDPNEILREHILDSLGCLLFSPLSQARHLADVGSGGGLPGIPLKILLPGARVVLIEATGKKAKFLEQVVQELGLNGVEVINARVEEVARDPRRREAQDVAVARAVAALPTLVEYCVPLVRVGGHMVAMKGRLMDEEMRQGEAAAKLLGAEVEEVLAVRRLPEVGEEKQRALVILTKERESPERYPRKTGIPAKRPLPKGR